MSTGGSLAKWAARADLRQTCRPVRCHCVAQRGRAQAQRDSIIRGRSSSRWLIKSNEQTVRLAASDAAERRSQDWQLTSGSTLRPQTDGSGRVEPRWHWLAAVTQRDRSLVRPPSANCGPSERRDRSALKAAAGKLNRNWSARVICIRLQARLVRRPRVEPPGSSRLIPLMAERLSSRDQLIECELGVSPGARRESGRLGPICATHVAAGVCWFALTRSLVSEPPEDLIK